MLFFSRGYIPTNISFQVDHASGIAGIYWLSCFLPQLWQPTFAKGNLTWHPHDIWDGNHPNIFKKPLLNPQGWTITFATQVFPSVRDVSFHVFEPWFVVPCHHHPPQPLDVDNVTFGVLSLFRSLKKPLGVSWSESYATFWSWSGSSRYKMDVYMANMIQLSIVVYWDSSISINIDKKLVSTIVPRCWIQISIMGMSHNYKLKGQNYFKRSPAAQHIFGVPAILRWLHPRKLTAGSPKIDGLLTVSPFPRSVFFRFQPFVFGLLWGLPPGSVTPSGVSASLISRSFEINKKHGQIRSRSGS